MIKRVIIPPASSFSHFSAENRYILTISVQRQSPILAFCKLSGTRVRKFGSHVQGVLHNPGERQQSSASVLKIHHTCDPARSHSLSMHPVHYQRAPTQTCRQFCGVCDGFCACVTSPRAAWTRNSASPRPTEMNNPMKLKQEGDRRLRRSRM